METNYNTDAQRPEHEIKYSARSLRGEAKMSNRTCISQCVYMTLKKNELLGQSDYDRIFKMQVYTLVWLTSDRIGFLIVGLKHLDYSIDSRVTPACIRSI